jgi:acetylornithine deacetylase/succinyl-diaminopimelate desuccinylase-like protein
MNKIYLLAITFFINSSMPVIGQYMDVRKLDSMVRDIMPETIREHREIVSIPNDSNYPDDMDENVEWIKPAMERRGFQVKVLETETIPVIFGSMSIDEDLPTVLFYIHYDGQPVDPQEWDQEHPFIPVIKVLKGEDKIKIPYGDEENWDPEWRVYARAAADDKGPLMMVLKALDVMKKLGIKPAYNINLVLDGEEERGSRGLKFALKKHKTLFEADRMIIMDGPAHPSNKPTLTFGCRGNSSATLIIYGPRTAQHSGHFGNYAPNPVFHASHLLSSMKDQTGRVIIPGFYDGIALDKATLAVLENVPDNPSALNKQVGIAQPDNVGKNYQESLQYPSLNVRGMVSGWVGKQTRTIIPDRVTIQLGVRLVMETEGSRMLDLVKKHIINQGYYLLEREPTEEERLTYPRIATFIKGGVTNAFRTELDSPSGKWLTDALKMVHQVDPVKIRTMGGTVPITPMIQELNIPAVIVPMVNMDNNQHSPNENLRLGNLYDGIKTCVGIFVSPL